jgi:NIPSNAP
MSGNDGQEASSPSLDVSAASSNLPRISREPTLPPHAVDAPSEPGWSPIVELGQYKLHPGRRDTLVELFDSKLVEPQERAGMKVIGQFRDLDDSDTLTWLRGFPSMPQRERSPTEFYDGGDWQLHRDAANPTMIDSANVLLLRPARVGSAFTLEDDRLFPNDGGGQHRGFVIATVIQLDLRPDAARTASFFERVIMRTVVEAGGMVLAYFVTEPSRSTFPRLPVREGQDVFVSFVGCPDHETLSRVSRATAAGAPARQRLAQVLRLAPTARSLLHGRSEACASTFQRTDHVTEGTTR